MPWWWGYTETVLPRPPRLHRISTQTDLALSSSGAELKILETPLFNLQEMGAFARRRRRIACGRGTPPNTRQPFVSDNAAWDCYTAARFVVTQQRWRPMARELEGKVAAVTGAASGIGLASTEAMLAAGSRVVMVDRDEAALKALCNKHGNAVIPLVIDLLDPKDCATLLPRVLEKAGQLDILHANAGTYVGGDLVDADTGAIDRMLNLNVNVVMKNVHDVLPHMIERRTGDIIVTSSLAAHFPTPWEPVYASSKWAINCFVQTVRRQVFKHGIRVGSISPGPVISALLADWPPEKLKEAKESGSLLEASEVANVVTFMLTRPRGMTIRDVVMLPTNFDL